ncbi:hypothetical protein MMC20_004959 [Loxospora ochrophaea]|nr:hypothetical protein [Loxospora ochrophaea]
MCEKWVWFYDCKKHTYFSGKSKDIKRCKKYSDRTGCPLNSDGKLKQRVAGDTDTVCPQCPNSGKAKAKKRTTRGFWEMPKNRTGDSRRRSSEEKRRDGDSGRSSTLESSARGMDLGDFKAHRDPGGPGTPRTLRTPTDLGDFKSDRDLFEGREVPVDLGDRGSRGESSRSSNLIDLRTPTSDGGRGSRVWSLRSSDLGVPRSPTSDGSRRRRGESRHSNLTVPRTLTSDGNRGRSRGREESQRGGYGESEEDFPGGLVGDGESDRDWHPVLDWKDDDIGQVAQRERQSPQDKQHKQIPRW